jgi:hypothetical protein
VTIFTQSGQTSVRNRRGVDSREPNHASYITAAQRTLNEPLIGGTPRQRPVQSRTPVLLKFLILLPSVTATGRWRERVRIRTS